MVQYVIVANIQNIFSLIGQEKYNIARIVLLVLNVVLFDKIKTATFTFRERMKIY